MSKKIQLLGILICVFLAAGFLCASQTKHTSTFSVDAKDSESLIGKPPKGFLLLNNLNSLQLPTSGYRVYLVGEAHGYKENEAIFLHYLSLLYQKSGLRNVVIEEDQVYEDEAQAFVMGKQNDLPEGLCLRANILEGVRRFNQSLHADQKVHVHLVDIDSPAHTILQHLSDLKKRIGKASEDLQIPEEQNFSTDRAGLLIDYLESLTSNRKILSELRTVSQSLIVYDNGFRAHTGDVEGNPLDPVREKAITQNMLELLRTIAVKTPVLGLYGDMHVRGSPVTRLNPLTGESYEHLPMAYRLEEEDIRVYKFACHPLSGSWQWRWGLVEMREDEAGKFKLASGETLLDIFKGAQDSPFLFVDFSSGVRLMKEVDEFSRFFDSCLFIRKANPMASRC